MAADQTCKAPYQPIFDALAEWQRRHAEAVAAVGLGPDLLQVPDIPVNEVPEAARFRLFERMAESVCALAGLRPALFVVEDVHWAAGGTIELVAHLVRALRGHRVLLAVTYRQTELTPALQRWLGELHREPNVDRLVLGGLDADAVDKLASKYARTDSGAELRKRTGGNPFFLGELLRGHTDDHDPPAAVVDTITGRLERLPPLSREALAVGAVIGPTFDIGVVTACLRRPSVEVVEALDAAITDRLLVELAEGHNLGFPHALVREGVLAASTGVRRAQRHADVARVLETRPGTSAATLAAHFSAAAELDPELAASAIRYSTQAVDEAVSAFGWHEAQHHLVAALDVADRTGATGIDPGAALTRLAEIALAGGDYPTAWRASMQAMERYRMKGDAVGVARAAVPALRIFAPEERRESVTEEALAGLGDAEPSLEVELRIQRMLRRPGPVVRDDPDLRRVEELVERHKLDSCRPDVLRAHGHVEAELGHQDEALARFRQAFDDAMHQGRIVAAADTYLAIVRMALWGTLPHHVEGAVIDEGVGFVQRHHIGYLRENLWCARAGQASIDGK